MTSIQRSRIMKLIGASTTLRKQYLKPDQVQRNRMALPWLKPKSTT
ncbi:uncharacterized protein G2W53_008938 [Senna tora]|uniref:Uncharacterized protein n=1 Tax=Senna tora TaxID=362788 RepID=A0A834WX92_9FABA|nr:uncharacterized protein G2W53_008938 [Senna tora]